MEGQIPRAGGAVDWLAAARSLGSDVPFFLAGTGALVEGTGERGHRRRIVAASWTVVVRRRSTSRPPRPTACSTTSANAHRWRRGRAAPARRSTRSKPCNAATSARSSRCRATTSNRWCAGVSEVARAHAALAEASGGRALPERLGLVFVRAVRNTSARARGGRADRRCGRASVRRTIRERRAVAMTAVVLAGGGRDEVCEADPTAPNKAFVAIAAGARSSSARSRRCGRRRASARFFAVAPAAAFGSAALAGADGLRPSARAWPTACARASPACHPPTSSSSPRSDLPILKLRSRRRVRRCRPGVRRRHRLRVRRTAHASGALPRRTAHLGAHARRELLRRRPRRDQAACAGRLERFLGRLGDAREDPLQLASIFG